MKGFCKDCGQMHLVDAKSQKEADAIATDCELVHKEFIESVKVSAADSEVVITRVLSKINIVRKRKQQNQMTI